MLDNVILIGRLGQNAEAKTSTTNKKDVTLSLAAQQSWKNDKGDYETRTKLHRVFAWTNLSKFARTLQKGQMIALEGSGIARTRKTPTAPQSSTGSPRFTPPA